MDHANCTLHDYACGLCACSHSWLYILTCYFFIYLYAHGHAFATYLSGNSLRQVLALEKHKRKMQRVWKWTHTFPVVIIYSILIMCMLDEVVMGLRVAGPVLKVMICPFEVGVEHGRWNDKWDQWQSQPNQPKPTSILRQEINREREDENKHVQSTDCLLSGCSIVFMLLWYFSLLVWTWLLSESCLISLSGHSLHNIILHSLFNSDAFSKFPIVSCGTFTKIW